MDKNIPNDISTGGQLAIEIVQFLRVIAQLFSNHDNVGHSAKTFLNNTSNISPPAPVASTPASEPDVTQNEMQLTIPAGVSKEQLAAIAAIIGKK